MRRKPQVREFVIADLSGRADEKQASREGDMARLQQGKISRHDLARENDFFGSLRLEDSHIVALGRRRIVAS